MLTKIFAKLITIFLIVFSLTQYSKANGIAGGSTSTTMRLDNARVDDIDKNFTFITVADCNPKCGQPVKKLSVNDALIAEIKRFHLGDMSPSISTAIN